jgi:hypothetical protein
MFRMNGISQGAHGCAVRLSQFCTALQLRGAIMHRMCCISQRAQGCAVRLSQFCTAHLLNGAIVRVLHNPKKFATGYADPSYRLVLTVGGRVSASGFCANAPVRPVGQQPALTVTGLPPLPSHPYGQPVAVQLRPWRPWQRFRRDLHHVWPYPSKR